MADDLEKGQEPPPQQQEPEQVELDQRKRRRTFGIVILVLLVIGLIVGLVVGLTRPSSNESSSSASLAQGQGDGSNSSPSEPSPSPPSSTSDETEDDTASETTARVKFQSSGRAFNVTMDLLSPDVLEGYDNEDDLKADLAEAVKFFINGFIEDQIQYGRYTYIYEGPMMDVGAVAEGDEATADNAASAGPPGAGGRGESAAGATDFETNNQVDGVDEADMVKSDGTYVYAVYGDAVVVWEAATGAYVTNYTLPPIAESNVRARELEMAANASSGSMGMGGGNAFNRSTGMGDGYATDGSMGMGDAMMPWIPKPWITGLSLENDNLILYVSGYGPEVVAEKNITSACSYDAYATRVMVFGTTPPLTLKSVKDVHGSFRDARAIGDDIYLVTTCGFDFYSIVEPLYIMNDAFVNLTDSNYRAAAAKKAEPLVDGFVELMIKDINAHGPSKIPKISLWGTQYGNNTAVVEQANAGGAIQAYTSLISFSVADVVEGDDIELSSAGALTPSSWGYTYTIDGWVVFAAQGWEWNRDLGGTSQSTYLLGFSIDGTTASPAIIGSFPGYILNQYSLSIYDGYLRVATTIQSWFSDVVEPTPVDSNSTVGDSTGSTNVTGATTSTNATNSTDGGTVSAPGGFAWPVPLSITQNQVIILKLPTAEGELLEEVSRISDLGTEGESITAINYFGRIAYAVTFLQTDPFYVLDLNPSDPSVLGELVITGFSSYIHSINENNTLLVGVGEEADENGTVLGVKISLFDATKPASPKEIQSAAVETDANSWSYTDASFDYKAFRWLSLGDGVGLVILPVRIDTWDPDRHCINCRKL
ncbi:hypothetical protein MHU86_20029 [Fragilaria crotonensis]|nr:hypothetical protein MHU86_20029 [Fragilaria crotonensis]